MTVEKGVMCPEAFFEELKHKPQKRYAFVLGNGINYHLGNNAVSWNELLGNFIREHHNEFASILNGKDIANTEVVNLLEFLIEGDSDDKKDSAEKRNELMDFLNEHLNFCERKKSAMLDRAWEKHHILTTNFDGNIEEYIASATGRRTKRCRAEAGNDAEKVNSNGFYPWNRFWGWADCPKEKDPLDHHNTIWHIHGKTDTTSSLSVLFSLTRYVKAIKRVVEWKQPSEPNWPGRNTWVNIFYNAPLIIAGLGLTNQEVFLRTLLIERKRYWKKKGGEPQSYYLVRKSADGKEESDGRMFLRALGFKVVEFDNAEELYDSKNW